MPTLDTAFVRRQFPAFSEPSLAGWAFFENAGGSYACGPVVERLHRFYRETKVQPYAPYPVGEAAGAAMDESYARLAPYLGVTPDEVNFGPSTSQNTYVLAHAFRAGMQPGDEIVVTNQDHEANTGAWRRLAETGIVVREWRVDPATGQLDPADLAGLLGERTRLVAFPHCSNIVAHVNPVAKICAMARAAGARTVVDGVSYAPHGFPDVAALGADIYLFSLYKTYGPHQGLMVVRSETRQALANQSHYFNADEARKKLVPAGPDHAQVAAAAGIADYFDTLHAHHFPGSHAAPGERGRALHDLMRAHEQALLAPLLDYLSARNDVRVLGPTRASERAPTVAVEIPGDPEETARALAGHKVMCWAGDFYARRLVEAMGVAPEPGVLRLSFVHYTERAEVERLIAALDRVLSTKT
ncbi:MAG: aminotransferase class V-fold PLP-dependent enzyme [Rhizobiales bacterium]|nr:aminotransferase class V-fold PLP-dependent enzyme [Hyphomicrobiales bacterium]